MSDHDPKRYGPVFAAVLDPSISMPLGPGKPQTAQRPALAELSVNNAFADRKLVDADMANACLAGVWLLHSFLDESHRVSQEIDTPTGSYWHGIMHRREPDYSNAKYWFRRVGDHPVFEPLAAVAAELANACEDTRAVHLTSEPAWDPFDFVDLCETSAEAGGELETLCRQIQTREWWLLFDYCYRCAIGQ